VRGERVVRAAAIAWLTVIGMIAAVGADVVPWFGHPEARDLPARQAPSWSHLFGTDDNARDVLARVLHGARPTIGAALVATGTACVLGMAFGLTSGFWRGRLGAVIDLAVDVGLALPGLVVVLVLGSFSDLSLVPLSAALGVLGAPAVARLSRAACVAEAGMAYVEAARVAGAPGRRILIVDVIPNIVHLLLAIVLVALAASIAALSSLSFLGLGLPRPDTSWGSLVADGRASLRIAPHVALLPALVLTLTVASLQWLVDDAHAILR
jgi:peptide/nickel transport system permease protein